ncbi:MAG: hypothetical protein EOO75_16475 [Myxococcales bacterium]|nr:MAG: hypothetical protein EOO75_16475 [Myxococcales bacterium]
MNSSARSWWLRACPLLLGLLSCSGEDDSDRMCTLIGCQDSYALTVSSPDGTWPEGSYKLHVDLDSQGHDVDFVIDRPILGLGRDVIGGPEMSVSFLPEQPCPASGCTNVTRHHLVISGAKSPSTAKLTLSFNGQTVVDQGGDLLVSSSTPNGPDCEPTCRFAETKYTADVSATK